MKDVLTKVFNKRYMEIVQNERIKDSGNNVFSVAILDSDFFKLFNDE